MAGRGYIAIPDLDVLAKQYAAGASVSDLARDRDFDPGTLRRRFVKMGIMRDGKVAIRLAFAQGKMEGRRTRKGVPQSADAKRKQSETMRRNADATARGWRISSNGYVELTRQGKGAGRSLHVLIMEERIGRRLEPDECVHHIDGDKLNNDIDNLALMTRKAHARLHRFEDALAGNERERTLTGQFK